MKKIVTVSAVFLLFTSVLSGCAAVGDKSTSLAAIYCAAAIVSFLLLIGCCLFVREKKAWFILLFASVLVVNIGYMLLSVSTCLEMALMANRIAYLGSVSLPFSMLMIICNVTNTQHKKWLPGALLGLAGIVFLVAASPGILDIYYKEVSFEIVNGVSVLNKVYGPLHPLYLLYLVGYFATMVTVIIRASVAKTVDTTAHAVILAMAVFVNIGVWLIEQLASFDFEMLSVSYIISELFLLGVHLVMNETQRLRQIVKQVEAVQNYPEQEGTSADVMLEKPLETETVDPERLESFINGLQKLTPTERAIYDAYIARATTKEVMASLNITENTLKYHNRNIYSKLEVASRKDLLEIYKHIQHAKVNFPESDHEAFHSPVTK